MKRSIFRICAALAFAAISATACTAQTSLEKVAKKIHSSPRIEATITEQRDPETKKLVKATRIYQFNDKSLADELKNAFENERCNSLKTTITKNYYYMKFDNGASYYFCTGNGSQRYSLIIKEGESQKSSYKDKFSSMDWNWDFGDYQFNDGNVTIINGDVDLDDPNCLNQIISNAKAKSKSKSKSKSSSSKRNTIKKTTYTYPEKTKGKITTINVNGETYTFVTPSK